MKINSVKGTNDYLPNDMKLRLYLENSIYNTYISQGFERIYTPIIEDIENLENSDGGDNLKLIFKILKRGEKLDEAKLSGGELCDMGLRYDLTLPLTRFYSAHKEALPNPFKVIQIGNVYRAERPQKGRNREFVQCDIDILGDETVNAEIELIHTTARALLNLGLKDFNIRINHRGILRGILFGLGFKEEELDTVCVSFDKLDKVGVSGIVQELTDKDLDEVAVKKFEDFINNLPTNFEELEKICGDEKAICDVKTVMETVKVLADGKYKIRFDLSLVRGQGYYTGCVFEIESKEFSCSLGGGGRYDNLVGKFTGDKTCAVGFSIGFERLFAVMKEKNFDFDKKQKFAVIYTDDTLIQGMKFAIEKQGEYQTGLFRKSKKFGKLLEKLKALGYTKFAVTDENLEEKDI